MPEFILLYFIPLQKLFISIHIIKYVMLVFIVRFKKEAVYILVLFEQQSQTLTVALVHSLFSS